jgi:hypothetical protein
LTVKDLRAHLPAGPGRARRAGPRRGGYLWVIDGRLSLDDNSLRTGDAAKVTGENALQSAMEVTSELILIDVPLEFESVGVWRAAEGGS